MKTLIITLTASLVLGGFALAADEKGAEKKPARPEQPKRPEGARPGGGAGGGIAEAIKKLDKDGNGSITKEEAGEAWARVSRLDKNSDGTIGKDEFPQAAPGGPNRRPGEGQGRGAPNPEMLAQFFGRLDTNGDGQITSEEAGERWERWKNADADKNGTVSKDEFTKGIAALAQRMGGKGGRPGGGQLFERADTNKDGKITKEEAGEQRWQFLSRMDKNEDGAITKDEIPQGRPGEGGPGRPGQGGGGANPLFGKFDKNNDGKLSKEEVPADNWAKISRADEDADGLVSQEELVKIMGQYRGGDKGKGKGKGPGRPEGEKKPAPKKDS